MNKVGVESEEMDRALTEPVIVANLTFGGTMVTTNGVGQILNPLGLFSFDRCCKMLFCPNKVLPMMPFVNGGEWL